MNARRLTLQIGSTYGNVRHMAALCALIAFLATACTTPGAVAPSTMPVTGKHVELGPAEESSSCGYIILFIPIKNPNPVSTIIEDMIKGRGGDALIEVSSSSSTTSFLLFTSNCVEVRGKVVNFTK